MGNNRLRMILLGFMVPAISLSLKAQDKNSMVYGFVVDRETMQPIPFAQVYISGTTKGSMTNEEGFFKLEKVGFPCKLAVSHLSYAPDVKTLTGPPGDALHFTLDIRNIEIPGVEVVSSNQRQQNLRYFRKWFLGYGPVAASSKILNDSVIMFDNTDGRFKAYINEPLVIDIPMLGYKLHAEISGFKIKHDSVSGLYSGSALASFYYEPYELERKSKIREVARNRKERYYNSQMHFCRALFKDKLNASGYLLLTPEGSGDLQKMVPAGIRTDYNYDFTLMKIIGEKGNAYEIQYFENWRGEPKDLTKRKILSLDRPKKSTVIFLKDTCELRENGSSPDICIRFKGSIAFKGLMNLLPYDYQPDD